MSHLFAPLGLLGNRISGLFNTSFFDTEEIKKKNVVVIGYGWGGKGFCDNINTDKYNVIVVSKNNYMLNTPKLKNCIIDSPNYFDKKLMIENKKSEITFVIDECIEINKEKKFIETKNGSNSIINDIDAKFFVSYDNKISYDYLIISVGSEINDFGINGVKENCYFLKTMDDLNNLKNKLEEDYNKQIVVLGGGPVGIELAFELSKKYKNIKILEASNSILPMFSKSVCEYIKKELEKNEIELLLDTPAMKIGKNNVISKNNKNIDFDIAIWTGGIKQNNFLKKITNDKFVVNDYLKWSNEIYAIGDNIASKDLGPPTGQNAKQQGKYLANYFNNDFEGKPYKYQEIAKLIHSKDDIILESNGHVFLIPYFVQPLLDYFIEN
jgi:NADH dehydrogenase FAD-containing subunit